jgi:RHS repeat-associated protein
MRFTARSVCAFISILPLFPATQLLAQVAVVVTPKGDTETARNQYTSGYSATFRVTNETPGAGTTQFQITCNSHGPVVCDSIRPTTLTLNNGSTFATVTAYYSVGAAGTGQLVGRATAGAVSDTGYRAVPVQIPPGAPRVDFSFWLDSLQPLGRCAATCFAAAYSQSTVPYFTLDAARGVTLVYQGDRVAANTFVLVDVQPDGAFANPTEYQLGIKFGSIQYPFVNGDTILHFAFPTSNGSQSHRLGGQFASDTISHFGHGVVFPMEIQVSSKISGTLYTNRLPTRYLSVNEATSPIARGWTISGVQRAWIQSDGSLMITDGAGNISYFPKSGSAFVTPTGEFSTVTSVTGGYVRSYPDSLKVFFNAGGGIVDSVKDRFGNRTYYQYDGSGRLQYIWDPIMQLTTLTYGTYGLSSVTDASGRVTNFTVLSNRTLTTITDPDGVATTFGYVSNGRLSTVTDRNGATTTLGYDSQSGKLATVTYPSIPIFGTSSQSPVDSVFDWHKRGVPYSTTLTTPITIPKSDTLFGRVKDPEGHVTKFTVNRWGQPTQITNALNKVTVVHYTDAGLPDSVAGPGYGQAFDRMVYNADGLPTASYSAAKDTVLITYGGWAQPTIVRAKGRDSTRYILGSNGRIDTVRVGGPVAQTMTYDTRGRVLLTRNGQGDTVQSITYRSNGYQNTQLIVRPGPRIVRLIQDIYGRLAAVKDSSAGLPDQLIYYDSLNRVRSVQRPDGFTITYSYGGLYLRKVAFPWSDSLPIPGVDSVATVYNALGWPILTKDARGRTDSLMYNRDGLLVRTRTRRSLNLDIAYDAVHRPIQRIGTDTVAISYNDDSLKVISKSAQSTDTTFANLRGQPVRVVTVLAGRPYTQTYHYTTPGGLLDTLRAVGLASDSFVVRTFSYDTQRGLLSTLALRSQTTTLDYDNNWNITKFTYPFSTFDSLTRGGLTAPNKRTSDAVANTTVERWLGYNAIGQIDRHLRHTQKIGRWFTYDSLGQLRQGTNRLRVPDSLPTGCPNYDYGMSGSCTPITSYNPLDSARYLYSAVGNRLDLLAHYDSTGTRITFFNGCNYATDLEGNTTSRTTGSGTCPAPIDSLVWNAEGQLKRLVFPSGVKIAYYYDGAGRVVRKDSAGAARAYYLWAGDHLFAELNSAATTKTAEYAYNAGMDRPQALIVGQSIYRARLDGLGNVLALTDSAGAVKRTYTYDDWGLTGTGSDAGNFNSRDRMRWKGALWMGPEVDLYFMRSRWYEPATGRFLSEDPMGLRGGLNLFAYAANDPVNGRDPTGGCLIRGFQVFSWDAEKKHWVWIYDEITSIDCGRGELMNHQDGPSKGRGDGGGPKLDKVPFVEVTPTKTQCFVDNMRRGADIFGLPTTMFAGLGGTYVAVGSAAKVVGGRAATSIAIKEMLTVRPPGNYSGTMTESEIMASARAGEMSEIAASGGRMARFGDGMLKAAAAFAVGYAIGSWLDCGQQP